MWIIRDKLGHAWSNRYGWIAANEPSVTRFTDHEKQIVNLPIGGEWIPLSSLRAGQQLNERYPWGYRSKENEP